MPTFLPFVLLSLVLFMVVTALLQIVKEVEKIRSKPFYLFVLPLNFLFALTFTFLAIIDHPALVVTVPIWGMAVFLIILRTSPPQAQPI